MRISDEPETVDFGPTAQDYARHRPGFPPELFDEVRGSGIGLRGQRVLDLGTGTGTLARGFAERGCEAVGVDPSQPMLDEAAKLAADAGLSVSWVCARAEETGFADRTFDIVCAGMCWHWFDRGRVATEVARLLRPGGKMLIAYFSYLVDPGTVGAITEELVLRYHPTWTFAGEDGRHPRYTEDLIKAGLRHIRTFDVVLPVSFTHESWRGRMRACNGVVVLPPESLAAFDADLARILTERFPEPIVSQHRLFGIIAEKP